MSKKKRIEELEAEVEYLKDQVNCWMELCETKEELLDSLEEDYEVLQEALEASLAVQGVPYATIFNRLKLKWMQKGKERTGTEDWLRKLECDDYE